MDLILRYNTTYPPIFDKCTVSVHVPVISKSCITPNQLKQAAFNISKVPGRLLYIYLATKNKFSSLARRWIVIIIYNIYNSNSLETYLLVPSICAISILLLMSRVLDQSVQTINPKP